MPKEIGIEEKVNLSGLELEEEELINLYLERRGDVLKIVQYGLKYDFNAGLIKKALWKIAHTSDVSAAVAFLNSKRKMEICLMRKEDSLVLGRDGRQCYVINFGYHFVTEKKRLLKQLPECPYESIRSSFWAYDKIESILKMNTRELEALYKVCGLDRRTFSAVEHKIRDLIGAGGFVEKVKELRAAVKKQKEAKKRALERREINYREVTEEINKEIVAESEIGWITMNNLDIYVFTHGGGIYKSTDWPPESKKMNFLYTLKKSNKIPASFRKIKFEEIPEDIINKLKERKPEIAVEIRLTND